MGRLCLFIGREKMRAWSTRPRWDPKRKSPEAVSHEPGGRQVGACLHIALVIKLVPAGVGNVVKIVSYDDAVRGVCGWRGLFDHLAGGNPGERRIEFELDDALRIRAVLGEDQRAVV